MERSTGSRRARLVLAIVAALASIVAVLVAVVIGAGLRRLAIEPDRFEPRAVPAEELDLAVACLALGTVVPPVEDLARTELEAIVAIVARLLDAYGRGSFESFLALRARDLGSAEEAHAGELEELRALCLELGIPPGTIPKGWIGALRAFWTAYYVDPPVLSFFPERVRVELRSRVPAGSAGEWQGSFEALCNRIPGATIWHRLMVPHRRALEVIAAARGTLTWIDLDLAFEARQPPSGRLVARFVWDEISSEWFLERAATVYEDGVGTDRRCLVL